jgi:hypothetical protein
MGKIKKEISNIVLNYVAGTHNIKSVKDIKPEILIKDRYLRLMMENVKRIYETIAHNSRLSNLFAKMLSQVNANVKSYQPDVIWDMGTIIEEVYNPVIGENVYRRRLVWALRPTGTAIFNSNDKEIADHWLKLSKKIYEIDLDRLSLKKIA